MVAFDERLGYLALGCVIGFILGYFVRALQEIKDELDEVDDIVKRNDQKDIPKRVPERRVRDERGFVRSPILLDIALLTVVALTVWAALASQRASNDIQKTQDELSRVSFCNQQYLSKTIVALNERTTYTLRQNDSNVDLQRSQAEFLAVVLERPQASSARRSQALKKYFTSLIRFNELSGKTEQKVQSNPFPTNQDLVSCLNPE